MIRRERTQHFMLHWLAILSLAGLFSILVVPASVHADSDSKVITLRPLEVSSGVDTVVTLTATVRYEEDADPVPNQKVLFTIKGVHTLKHDPASAITDNNGQATFSYTGFRVGMDEATAFLDSNNNGTLDPGEPSSTSDVNWTLAELVLLPSSQTLPTGHKTIVKATVTGALTATAIRYSVAGANPQTGGNVVATNGSADIEIGSNVNGVDTITSYADLNNNSKQDPEEPSATAHVNWVSDSDLRLEPTAQDASINSTATVTATLSSGFTPLSGITIYFYGANADKLIPDSGPSGSAKTDANGRATYTYSGQIATTDSILAYADLNGNGQRDADEPATTVQVNWHEHETTVPPPPLAPADVIKAAEPTPKRVGCLFSPETGHNACGEFATYWADHGGLTTIGYPITEPFVVNGQTVQYFERQILELHPENNDPAYQVEGALVGNIVTDGRSAEPLFQPTTANPSGDCTFYADTGHNSCGGFRAYWQKYGGLPTFGFPISDEFQEVNPDTGKIYTVQYYQRVRVEWHPGEAPDNFDVMLGRLGAQIFTMRYGMPNS